MSKFGYAPGNGTYTLRVRVPAQNGRCDCLDVPRPRTVWSSDSGLTIRKVGVCRCLQVSGSLGFGVEMRQACVP